MLVGREVERPVEEELADGVGLVCVGREEALEFEDEWEVACEERVRLWDGLSMVCVVGSQSVSQSVRQ